MTQIDAELDVAGLSRAARPAPTPRPRRKGSALVWVAEHTVLVALAVLFVAPIVFVFLTSVMGSDQALTSSLWPRHWDWSNYAHAFQVAPLAAWFGNSALYAVLATAFMLVSSVPAAYALAKIPFRGSNLLFVAIIVAMLLPPQVVTIPQYVMWTKLHLTGTLWPLILPNLLGDAFSIFLLRQFFLTIPTEYAEAARIDGAGELRVIWKVMIPMAKPGIAATAMFLFFHSWNDYYGPLLYTSEADPDHWPVALGMASFKGAHSVDWSTTMALTMLVMVPVVVLFFFAQRAFVEGVTLTGVKG